MGKSASQYPLIRDPSFLLSPNSNIPSLIGEAKQEGEEAFELSYELKMEKRKLINNHNLLLHEKEKCNLSFLQITKYIIKKIHFYGLYMLQEKVDLNELKINESIKEAEMLSNIVIEQQKKI